MAMLGAWLGLRGSLESFFLAVFAASAAAILWLAVLTIRRNTSEWAKMPLPLGTFLCVAALVEVFCPHWLLNPGRLGF
jgi:prepilin signal peptidase PulO-like enzyme (type II secretory pathway)